MGLLDRINEARQRSAREAAEAELRKRREAIEAAQRSVRNSELRAQARENSVVAHITDSKAIIELLGKLPEADYAKYFNAVFEFTGYSHRVGLYSHPKLNLDSSHPLAQETEEVSAELAKSLQTRNIAVSRIGNSYTYQTSEEGSTTRGEFDLGFDHSLDNFPLVYLPEREFLDGGYVHTYGYETPQPKFDMKGMHEPHQPGIGIHLFKYADYDFGPDDHYKGKGYGSWTTTTHRSVYLRFLPSMDLVLTGTSRQKKERVTSFKKLDDAVEQVMSHPLTYTKREFTSKYYHTGGD